MPQPSDLTFQPSNLTFFLKPAFPAPSNLSFLPHLGHFEVNTSLFPTDFFPLKFELKKSIGSIPFWNPLVAVLGPPGRRHAGLRRSCDLATDDTRFTRFGFFAHFIFLRESTLVHLLELVAVQVLEGRTRIGQCGDEVSWVFCQIIQQPSDVSRCMVPDERTWLLTFHTGTLGMHKLPAGTTLSF